MANAKIDNEWVRCYKCGRKLGKRVGAWNDMKKFPALEIKCSSCKEINYVMVGCQYNNSEELKHEKN